MFGKSKWTSHSPLPPPEVVDSNKLAADKPKAGLTQDGFNVSFSKFVETSTVHGVKYVFAESPYRWRRALWLVLVIGTMLGFCINAGIRAKDYFDYKTNVDVEIRYRINKSRQLWSIQFLGLHLWDKHQAVEGSEDFEMKTAHERSHFIQRCRWNGVSCNETEFFQKIITDLGVCFTFNKGATLEVTEPGSGYGLSVVINVEQYEYMRGPQNGAGIKVLLHDPAEQPLMKDLGFSVAPGRQALIGIKRTQISTLEPPYGTCQLQAPPLSFCRLRCRTQHVIKQCGCRVGFMKPFCKSTVPVCNLFRAYTCVRWALGELQEEGGQCECNVPCRRTTYEPTLSYAVLSSHNVERVAFQSDSDKADVQRRFLMAKETAQRALPAIRDTDAALIAEISSRTAALLEAISPLYRDMATSRTFARARDTFDLFSQHSLLRADFKTLRFGPVHKWKVPGHFMATLNHIWPAKLWTLIESFLEMNNSQSGLIEALEACQVAPENNIVTTQHPLYRVCAHQSLTNRAVVLKMQAKDHFYCRNSEDAELSENVGCFEYHNVTSGYNKTISIFFRNATQSPDLYAGHAMCLEQLTTYESYILPKIMTIYDKITNQFWSGKNMSDIITTAKRIRDDYIALNLTFRTYPMENYKRPNSRFTDLVYPNCTWLAGRRFNPPAGGTAGQLRDTALYRKLRETARNWYFSSGRAALLRLPRWYRELRAQLTSLHKLTAQRLHSLNQRLQAYTLHNSTKQQLAASAKDIDYMKSQLTETATDAEGVVTELTRLTSALRDDLQLVLRHGFDMTFPGVNRTDVLLLNIVTQARALAAGRTNPAIHLLDTQFEADRPGATIRVIEKLFKPYIEDMKEVGSKLDQSHTKLGETLTNMVERLTEYKQQIRMDTEFYRENFIQLDVFYKELSYQVVTQHEAFIFVSLMSEVGGFLGLLLGASIITVFEAIDFLVMSLAKKLEARRKVNFEQKDKANDRPASPAIESYSIQPIITS